MMRKTIGFTCLTLAVIAGACTDKHSDSAAGAADSVSVALPRIQPVTLSKSYPGYLTAAAEVTIVARVGGRLVAAPYVPGKVSKGQVLFTIDDTEYADAVHKAEAALQSARAQRSYAATHLEALEKALAADAVSKMEVEQARSSLQQIDAQIKTAEAVLTDARTQLGYCTVRAPFDGRVAKRKLDPGAILSPGQELTSIYDESHFSVNFDIEDSQYLAMLREGNGSIATGHIPVRFAEELPHEYFAELSYVSPSVSTSTGTYSLQARLEDPYGELRSGMFVTVDLPYARLDSALVVESAAIATDQRGEYLYTVSDSNKVVYTHIVTGQSVGDSLKVVTDGLSGDMPYVTKALLKVRPGMKIVPVHE